MSSIRSTISLMSSRLALLLLVSTVIALSGCGTGVFSSSTNLSSAAGASGSASQGIVLGGHQPVAGAHVQLFSASEAGRGSSAVPLLSSAVTTAKDGTFSLAKRYKCINNSDQVYVVATGNNVAPTPNANRAMMSAFGNCGDLAQSPQLLVNEVTTVAAVNMLAPYMTSSSYDIAANKDEAAALATAFTAARSLADPATASTTSAKAIAGSPAGAKLNSISNSLASCIDSTNATACHALFAATTPPGSATAPTNTIAAALNIASNPTSNIMPIYKLSGSATPFQPALTAAPTDWSLAGSAVAVPLITWANPASIHHDTQLSDTQLNATASIPGSFAYSPAAGAWLGTGLNTLSTTFTPTDTAKYGTRTASVSLQVDKDTPIILWPTPAPITQGTKLSSAQLNATAYLAGTFVYSAPFGSTPAAGNNRLAVTFTPTDTVNHNVATQTVNLVVTSSSQSTPVITWTNPAPIKHDTQLSAAQLNAASSVPGSFIYQPAAGAWLGTGPNMLSTTFTPADTTKYKVQTANVTLQVNKDTPIILWPAPAPITQGTKLSAAQLNATAYIAGTFAYSAAIGSTPPAGDTLLSVTFTPTDSANHAVATQAVHLAVTSTGQVAPVLTWANPAPITKGTTLSATQLNATASVPGTFAYSPGPGVIPDAGTATLSVAFTPSDTTKYSAATKTVSLAVTATDKAAPAIAWNAPAAITSGTALSATQLNATTSVPGTFAYSPGMGAIPSAGTATLSVAFTPTDTTKYSAATMTVSLAVTSTDKTAPAITWNTPAAIPSGTALSPTQLNATASVPGSFTYSPGPGAIPSAGTATLSVAFAPTDTTKYSAATKTVSLAVTSTDKTAPTITWNAPAAIPSGTALSPTQLNATASVPGSFVYSPAAGALLANGANALTVTFTPTDTTKYSTQTASVKLLVTGKPDTNVTDIAIADTVKQSGVKRLGMNIAGQDYYDSGQMLRNLVFRNPGFEGETWQTILQCKVVTATSCTDANQYTTWPADFIKGAQFEFIHGAAAGETGTVLSSSLNQGASKGLGIVVTFSQLNTAPAVNDYLIVKMTVPGNAQAGWWPNASGGGTLTTEFSDLAPNSPGKQALKMTSSGSGQSAQVSSFFDGYTGRSFVQLKGSYQITFRAKGAGGSNQMVVSLARNLASGIKSFFNQTVSLSPAWKDYTFAFTANETGTSIGTVGLSFSTSGADVLLDDVSVAPTTASADNPTPFRDEVVSTLTTLHPGVLRYMDSGTNFGSSIDNMIAVPFARVRAGMSTQSSLQEDVPLGLHEFLQLCQTVGAEPWYTMPAGMSTGEMQNLIQYLGGDASTPYGAKRSALGQAAPWTSVFPSIHLELGNEEWNAGVFYGAAINDPIAYGKRASLIFGAARSSASYNASSFDLVLGSWASVPYYTGQEIANSSNYDTVAVAPYLFYTLNDTSSNEAIYGPMFAQPESIDSVSSGIMAQQATTLSGGSGGKPAKLAIYELQLSTLSGSASQSAINAVVPSVGAGLAVADHMLLMMRDLGITTQNVWSLPGFSNQFNNTNGSSETTPLFGTVVDMGGSTNLRRPVFLAEQLTNTAILPTMLTTTLTGANPTWNQPLSTNDSIQFNNAHELQSFAFSDGGSNRSLIVLNLNRSQARPVTFSGSNVPSGTVAVGQLTSASLTDTNETAANVNITSTTLTDFQSGTPYSLPPFSMTVFTWKAAK